ncbi:CAP domain-containing protein [Streptomyces sp. S.PNR 29]|uniref:CAP domain-containing protein n=1 Tax=Streptomyces sp. S.PNR 29 TaxID=2973805 RepID=UPI0025AFBA35|nr:CAP domain-containing protein [Streptomyces sp. S.PNR 29]MDN0199686.1 CAP domain-containing protein [Streptomyces sp. S.PNR 29]
MGRHRRSAAGRAATGRAAEVTQTDGYATEGHDALGSYGEDRPTMGIAPYLNPEAYAGTYAETEAYLFAADDGDTRADDTAVFAGDGFTPSDGPRRAGAHRRRKKKAVPVKTGLLGVSAAVAIGTVAVATGAVPGLDNYKLGGGNNSADKVQAADSPTNVPTEQGGTSGSADSRAGGTATSRDSERPASPSASPSTSKATPTKTPTKTPAKTPTRTPSKKPATTPGTEKPKPPASQTATGKPERSSSSAPVTVSAEAAAEAQVLKLVNEERSKAGCSAVSANSALGELAEDFSDAMAAQGFFDHTDPSGASPWDRADKAGITDLGGENIARGQADAAAVMDAWMNSPGHRANILNCDFKTLGVGVHFGSGGPWWTQDFGY